MAGKLIKIKRDSRDRRTDRVKKREIAQMLRFQRQGLTYTEIAKKLLRKPETVKRHLDAECLGEESNLPMRAKAAQIDTTLELKQMEHIQSLQELARFAWEFHITAEPPDFSDLDKLHEFRASLWCTLVRLTGDARWPSLATHLGVQPDTWRRVTDSLELPLRRPQLSESTDKYVDETRDAWEMFTSAHFYTVVTAGDTREWEYDGLSRNCPWCPIQD